MKLTKQECESLVDSRLVDVENTLKNIKDNLVIANGTKILNMLDALICNSTALKDSYEAYVKAEEQVQIDEAEENKICGIDMAAGLDEALSIRKGE